MYVFDSILGNGAQQCCGDLDNFLQVTPTAITTAVTTAITTAVNRKQHRGTELRAQSRQGLHPGHDSRASRATVMSPVVTHTRTDEGNISVIKS